MFQSSYKMISFFKLHIAMGGKLLMMQLLIKAKY